MMLYYYSKEMRICIASKHESTSIKLAVILLHTALDLLCQSLIPEKLSKHRSNFKLELLIYDALIFQYMLTYPACYPCLLFFVHCVLQLVSIALLLTMIIVSSLQVPNISEFRCLHLDLTIGAARSGKL